MIILYIFLILIGCIAIVFVVQCRREINKLQRTKSNVTFSSDVTNDIKQQLTNDLNL